MRDLFNSQDGDGQKRALGEVVSCLQTLEVFPSQEDRFDVSPILHDIFYHCYNFRNMERLSIADILREFAKRSTDNKLRELAFRGLGLFVQGPRIPHCPKEYDQFHPEHLKTKYWAQPWALETTSQALREQSPPDLKLQVVRFIVAFASRDSGVANHVIEEEHKFHIIELLLNEHDNAYVS